MLDGQDQIARIKRAAEGRWREIAEAAGIPEVHLEKEGRPSSPSARYDDASRFDRDFSLPSHQASLA